MRFLIWIPNALEFIILFICLSHIVTRSTPTHVPIRKANSFQQSTSDMSEDSLRRGSEDSFVVHRGKNIPTLSSVIHDDVTSPRLRMAKEKQNDKGDERDLKMQAAGKPSNWEESRKSSYAGRRSRRNSVTDDSQLTIENFGGSQDNINFIGRNPDKEVSFFSRTEGKFWYFVIYFRLCRLHLFNSIHFQPIFLLKSKPTIYNNNFYKIY